MPDRSGFDSHIVVEVSLSLPRVRAKGIFREFVWPVNLFYWMLSLVGGKMQEALRSLVDAIVANDVSLFSGMMDRTPGLALASFSKGATRQGASIGPCFIQEIGHYIYAGDTALHFAAASYRQAMAARLIQAGANVQSEEPAWLRTAPCGGFWESRFAEVGSGGTSGDDCVFD